MSCCSKSSLSFLALAVSLPLCLTPPLSLRELGKARSCRQAGCGLPWGILQELLFCLAVPLHLDDLIGIPILPAGVA